MVSKKTKPDQDKSEVQSKILFCKIQGNFFCGIPDTARQPWNVLKFQWVQRQQAQAATREIAIRYQGKHPQWGERNPAVRAQRGWWISACGGVKHQTGQGLSSLPWAGPCQGRWEVLDHLTSSGPSQPKWFHHFAPVGKWNRPVESLFQISRPSSDKLRDMGSLLDT